MPQAIKHDLELRDRGLVVVLPEVQGSTLDKLPGFLWKTFPDCEARVTAGRGNLPVKVGRGIPFSVLIGVDGVVRWSGHPTAGTKELDALIEAELKKVAQGWGATPEVRKARAQLYGKGNLAEAKKLIAALADENEKTTLQQELATAFAWRVKAVQALRDEGRFVAAKQAAQALKKAVTGVREWEQQAQPLLAAFDQPDLQKELAASKRIEHTLAAIRSKKLKVGDAVKPMRAIGKSASGTKAGERADILIAAFEQAARPGKAE